MDQVGQQALPGLFQHAQPLDQGVKGLEQLANLLRALFWQGLPFTPAGDPIDGIGHLPQRTSQAQGQRQADDHGQQKRHSQYRRDEIPQIDQLVLDVGKVLRQADNAYDLLVLVDDRDEDLDNLGLYLAAVAPVDLLLAGEGRGEIGQIQGLAQRCAVFRIAGRQEVPLIVEQHDVRVGAHAEKGHEALGLRSVTPDGRLVPGKVGCEGAVLHQLVRECGQEDLGLQEVGEGKADDRDDQQQGQDVAQDEPAAQRPHQSLSPSME